MVPSEVYALKSLEEFYFRFVRNVSILLLTAHFLGCLYIWAQGLQEREIGLVYVEALYFIFMTASTVGYGDGDVGVETNHTNSFQKEYLIIAVYIYLLQVFFSFLDMTIRRTFQGWDRIYNVVEMNDEELNDWMAMRNRVKMVRSQFEKKIQNFFTFIRIWDVESTVKIELYRHLDHRSQTQVSNYIGFKIAEKFKFFDDFSEINKAAIAFSTKIIKYFQLIQF